MWRRGRVPPVVEIVGNGPLSVEFESDGGGGRGVSPPVDEIVVNGGGGGTSPPPGVEYEANRSGGGPSPPPGVEIEEIRAPQEERQCRGN